MSKRFKKAWNIWNGGACNPRAIARTLVEAIDEAAADTGDAIDPAVQMIMDHLCFIVGLPAGSQHDIVSFVGGFSGRISFEGSYWIKLPPRTVN